MIYTYESSQFGNTQFHKEDSSELSLWNNKVKKNPKSNISSSLISSLQHMHLLGHLKGTNLQRLLKSNCRCFIYSLAHQDYHFNVFGFIDLSVSQQRHT